MFAPRFESSRKFLRENWTVEKLLGQLSLKIGPDTGINPKTEQKTRKAEKKYIKITVTRYICSLKKTQTPNEEPLVLYLRERCV